MTLPLRLNGIAAGRVSRAESLPLRSRVGEGDGANVGVMLTLTGAGIGRVCGTGLVPADEDAVGLIAGGDERGLCTSSPAAATEKEKRRVIKR